MAMTEAAPSLMRSISQPLFASLEFKEGDPLRALTTSISFGRFMNEPLDWEKWSSFSHNRIREDVKKYSRPGAVAEKKAFFEAYFNKFASKKPPKKENKPPNHSPQTNVTISNIQENHSLTVATDENTNSTRVESEITSNQDVSSPGIINLVSLKTGNVDGVISTTYPEPFAATPNIVRGVESKITSTVATDENKNSRGVESEIISNQDAWSPSIINLVSSKTGNVDDVISTTYPEPFAAADIVRGVESEITSNEDVDDIVSSTSHVEHEKHSTNLFCSQIVNVEENMLSNRRAEGEKATTKDVCSSTVILQDMNVDDVISSSGQMEHVKRLTKNVSLENHLCKVKISKQSSHVDKNKKKLIKDKVSGQITSVISSSRKPEIHPKNQILKCNPRVSSVNVVKKTSQVLPRPENKRSKPLLDRLVNGNKTLVLKSHSTNLSETLIASTKKTISITVPSSFIFKSDERAAKRKQFFQKLEEKPKLKEEEKSHWSTALTTKPSTSERKGPTNKIQKIMQGQPSRTLPEKIGMKPKNFIEINKKILSSSIAFLPRKKSNT